MMEHELRLLFDKYSYCAGGRLGGEFIIIWLLVYLQDLYR